MYELIDNYFNNLIELPEFKRLLELKDIIRKKYALLIVGFKTNEANYEDAKRYKNHMDDFDLLREKLVESKRKLYEKEEVKEYFELEKKIQNIINTDLDYLKESISPKFKTNKRKCSLSRKNAVNDF
ncbi:MAG: hypothetical protein IKP12_07855 [Acholeplasmatales bacterium]|nr:hypothetical protein [Acholeplasmatales bacterium]